jgi:hypothetical protein
MIFLSVLPILVSASYGLRLFRPSPKRGRAWLAPPIKMRLAALLCHCRSWIQGSRFRKQLLRFGEAFQSFLTSNSLGDPRERIPVATMSPANCLRASADARTISGASLSILWSAHKPRTEPPTCSRRPTFSSAEVSTGSFPRASFHALRGWPCRCPKCRSQRETKQENECARSTGKAGNGNRTRMASLEGWNFTIKLCPREK